MTDHKFCCLCVSFAQDCKCLYDNNGLRNEVYQLMVKYFDTKHLNRDIYNHHLYCICIYCWQTIVDFDKFQQTVMEAQKKFPLSTGTSEYVTHVSEEGTSFFISELPEDFETDEQILPDNCSSDPSIVDSKPLPNAMENSEYDNEIALVVPKIEIIDVLEDNSNDNYRLLDDHKTSIANNMLDLEPDQNDMLLEPIDSSMNVNDDSTTSISDTSKIHKKYPMDSLIARWRSNLQCVVCHQYYTSLPLLEEHFRQEHPQNEFYIPCCSRKLKKRSYIIEHVRHHLFPNAHKCIQCKKSFSTKSTLKRHTILVHSSQNKTPNRQQPKDHGLYKCTICNKSFEMKKSLQLHNRKHDKYIADDGSNIHPRDECIAKMKPNLECVECGELCRTFTLLQHHFLQKHPNKAFYILCCNRKLRDRHHLKEHLLLHTNPETFKCKICSKLFTTRSHLLKHKRNSHPNEKDEYGNTPELSRKSTQEIDEAIAQQQPYLECPLCDVKCSTFTRLQDHFREIHPQEQCHVKCCKREFKRRDRLLDHIGLHINPNLYVCNICNKNFHSGSYLKYHRSIFHNVDDGPNIYSKLIIT